MNISSLLAKNKRPEQTVFLRSEVVQLAGEIGGKAVTDALFYATRRGYLHKISRDIYSLGLDYSKLELANKLRRPSYISLYTILQERGVVFQPYSSIFVVDSRSQEIELEGQKYIYRKIKDDILLNPLGIETLGEVSKATVERAICDKLYLDGLEYFDNLRGVDWEVMTKLNAEVYGYSKVITDFIERSKP